MLICVIEVIYITRSWSRFTSGRHPTLGRPRLCAISAAAVAARCARQGRWSPGFPGTAAAAPGAAVTHPAPRTPPVLAANAPAALPAVWRGSAVGRCQGRSGSLCQGSPSHRCGVQDGPRGPGSHGRCGSSCSAARTHLCCGPSKCTHRLSSRESLGSVQPWHCLLVHRDGILPAACLGKELGNAVGGLWVRGDSCCLYAEGANRLLSW